MQTSTLALTRTLHRQSATYRRFGSVASALRAIRRSQLYTDEGPPLGEVSGSWVQEQLEIEACGVTMELTKIGARKRAVSLKDASAALRGYYVRTACDTLTRRTRVFRSDSGAQDSEAAPANRDLGRVYQYINRVYSE